MLDHKPVDGTGDTLSDADRLAWLEIIFSIVKIFYALVSQDLPEYFEVGFLI